MASSWKSLVGLISRVLGLGHKQRHASITLATRLAADIWAVSLELRPACLLDGVDVNQDMALQIATGLKDITGLSDLWVFHERRSSSTFISSKKALLSRGDDPPIYIDISTSPSRLLDRAPNDVSSALIELCDTFRRQQNNNKGVVIMDLGAPASTLISLAGFLLGYPCVYCNCSSNQIILGPLKVVQVDLSTKNHHSASQNLININDSLPLQYRLMSFSFPGLLDRPGSALELAKLIQRLKNDIEAKLHSTGASFCGWDQVHVRVQEDVNLDRVAL